MVSVKYWIPDEDKLDEILRRAGYGSMEDLFSDIPIEVRVKDWDNLPIGRGKPLSEQELLEEMKSIHDDTQVFDNPPPFIGGGAWAHYVPAYIDYILQLGEFLTSYTPYQPEASQGLLQALFEYQSLIAEIYDLDVVNSSHYDGGTALAEAVLMSLRVKRGRNKILYPDTINPRYLKTVRAYTEPHSVDLVPVPTDPETGTVDLEVLEELVDDKTAAIIAEMPSFIGIIDPGLRDLAEYAHRKGALYIVVADPIASTIYHPPGELGADIAVGEGQPLGLGLNYGGPYLGIMAVRWDIKLIRQMPGRIAGLARDAEGRRSFALILQTREQHIRRARATSNITTNEAMMAILAAAFIAGHGFSGLRRLAEIIRAKTLYLKNGLKDLGVLAHTGEHFRDVLIRVPCKFSYLQDALAREKILVGPGAEDLQAGWAGQEYGVISVTEIHKKMHIDFLLEELEKMIGVCRQ